MEWRRTAAERGWVLGMKRWRTEENGRASRKRNKLKEKHERRRKKEGKCEWVFISIRHSEENDGVGTREQR